MPIIQFLLPEFILENVELIAIDRPKGIFHVHIEEKNVDQQDPERKNLVSKGFFPTITVQDFPIRGHQVFLHIKRRRWLNTQTGKVIYRDWTQVADGTRMTSEFAAFFKDISRYQPEYHQFHRWILWGGWQSSLASITSYKNECK